MVGGLPRLVPAMTGAMARLGGVCTGRNARRAAHGLAVRVHPRVDVVLHAVAVVVDSIGAEGERRLGHVAARRAVDRVRGVLEAVAVVVDVVRAVPCFGSRGGASVAAVTVHAAVPDAERRVAGAGVAGASITGVLRRASGEGEEGDETGPEQGRAIHAGHDAAFQPRFCSGRAPLWSKNGPG